MKQPPYTSWSWARLLKECLGRVTFALSLNYSIRWELPPKPQWLTASEKLLSNSWTHSRDSINLWPFFCCDWKHYFTVDYIKTWPSRHHSKLIGTAFLKDTEIRIIQTMTKGKVSRVLIKIPVLTRTSGIIPMSWISSPKDTVEKIEVQIG